jgi:DNA-binding protein
VTACRVRAKFVNNLFYFDIEFVAEQLHSERKNVYISTVKERWSRDLVEAVKNHFAFLIGVKEIF